MLRITRPTSGAGSFYAALGHGMTIVNLFEFRPVHVAYTENHVDDPHMYRMVLASLRELGAFEDIVQQGRIRGAQAGIWFSETADIWGDNHGSRAAAKRALYTAIRHGQLPVDVVIEQDALDGTLSNYKLLYLTDPHVSRAATARLAEWVHQGGCLFATAEAGRFDELNQPNEPLQKLLGIELLQTESPPESHVTWIKQDLPFATPIDTVHPSEITQGVVEPGASHRSSPVFGTCTRFRTLEECQVLFRFRDGSPAAVSRTVGNGRVIYCGFLPGLSYYLPAIPRRPVDRGATDDSMAHFLPTQFDHNMRSLITLPADLVERPVVCSEPLVESCIIESPHGTAIVLVNWTGKFQKNLQVTVHLPNLPRQALLATGPSVTGEIKDESLVFRLDLDVADALILRPNSRLE
ncbi:MAG: hypothetical protein KatS3mg110_2584 [Pirellulaceae bacterium]|nr:MAG: hypothetical protein KatS3mg110_2584 [Pirellulaceae bacterium]